MKEIAYQTMIPDLLKQLGDEGVFLTSGSGDKANTMTIGWGSIGIIWRRPIFTCAIRMDRYTRQILEQSAAFTVSIPDYGTLSEELRLMGTKSGRDGNKYEESGLTLLPGQAGDVPILAQCPVHMECRVVSSHIMEPGLTLPDVKKIYDSHQVYHTLYYGEIMACYRTEA